MHEHDAGDFINGVRPDKRASEEEFEEMRERVWEEFWFPLLKRETGTDQLVCVGPVWEQVKKELLDFHTLMSSVSEVYWDITGGVISKPLTDPSAVLSEARERQQECVGMDVIEFLEAQKGNRRPDDQQIIDELIAEAKTWFGIHDS